MADANPFSDPYALGMLGAASDNPIDRRVLFGQDALTSYDPTGGNMPATFAERFGPVLPRGVSAASPIERAVSATDLPADTSPRTSVWDWRYALKDVPQYQKDAAFRYANAEIGEDQLRRDPLARQKFLEGLVNRHQSEVEDAMRTGAKMPTLIDILSGRIASGHGGQKYYPPVTHGGAAATALTPDQQAYYEDLWQRIHGDQAGGIAPSNACNYCTGNESGRVRSGGAEIVSRGGGERHVVENWTRPFIAKLRGEEPPPAGETSTPTWPGSSGSVARPGSSPTVAEGATGQAGASSLPNASLAAALMPYLQGAGEAQKGADYAAILNTMKAKPGEAAPVDYAQFYRRYV
jgi:hypothetical protein